jgi:hypothetical protein
VAACGIIAGALGIIGTLEDFHCEAGLLGVVDQIEAMDIKKIVSALRSPWRRATSNG